MTAAITSKKVSVMRDSNLWLIFEIKVWRKGGGCSGKDSKNASASDQWDWPQSGPKIDSCTILSPNGSSSPGMQVCC